MFAKYDAQIVKTLLESGIGSEQEIIAASLLVNDCKDINAVAMKVIELNSAKSKRKSPSHKVNLCACL